jgi:hypothetical protein
MTTLIDAANWVASFVAGAGGIITGGMIALKWAAKSQVLIELIQSRKERYISDNDLKKRLSDNETAVKLEKIRSESYVASGEVKLRIDRD